MKNNKNKSKIKKRAALYGRFSPGPNQREESITGQMRENELYCSRNDLIVVKQYADRSLTGRTDERPQFQQMIKDAEQGLFDVVVCYKTDRFARDRFDAAIYKNKLKKNGVRVVYSKMSIPEGPEGVILESVLEGLDEYYSKDLAQKIIRGMYDNAIQGKALGGPVPLGLKINNEKRYIIDEDKAPLVREIFDRYARGEYACSICNDLNARGFRTARGGLFNKNSLHRMFKNLKYIGVMNYKSPDENFEDVRLEDAIPAIIDKDIFEKVQLRIKSNHRRTRRLDIPPAQFLLSGKMFDASCGGAFVGDSGTSKTKNVYYYYTCANRKIGRTCKTPSLRKEFIEELVVLKTREIVLKDSVIDFIAEQIVFLQEEAKDSNSLNEIRSEITETKKSLQNILKAIENGIYTETTKTRLLELEERQVQLETQLRAEELKIKAPNITKERLIYFLSQFANGDVTDEEHQKGILDSFVNSVIIDGDKMIIAYNFTGENDVIEVDFKEIKNSFDSVRMSSKWWRIGDSNS